MAVALPEAVTRSRTFTIQIGNRTVTFAPHCIPGVGPQVLVTVEQGGTRHTENWPAEALRLFNAHGTIAINEAEAMARREERQKGAA